MAQYKFKVGDSSCAPRGSASRSLIHNWFGGKTRRPQFATVNAVAMALGRELEERFEAAPIPVQMEDTRDYLKEITHERHST